ncbi:MAG: fluoride efflux transporter CrcB [Anaerolineales bacterium]|nr:fluoride efflux transporter CrcB [Anaerolineales bacterium]
MENFLLIGLGGFLGANVRYWVSGWVAERLGQIFPWGTFFVNFSGACLLAVFYGWSANHITLDPRVRLLVAIGFFGAYTTFSTYANESIALMETGDWIGMASNVVFMNLICLVGAWIGLAIGRQL